MTASAHLQSTAITEVIGEIRETRLAALVRFQDGLARRSRTTEAECASAGLSDAEKKNHARAEAHQETAAILQRLLHAAYPAQPDFTGHLDAKPPPKAQIRAPP